MVYEKILYHADGAIGVGESEDDYLAGSISPEIMKVKRFSGFLPNLNQQKDLNGVLNSACTYVNAFRPTHGMEYEGKQIDEGLLRSAWDYAKEEGYVEGRGNYSQKGFHTTRGFFNQLGVKYLYVRTTIGSKEYLHAAKLGAAIGVTYRGNLAYGADFKVDGVLDGVNFGEPTYGHMTCHKLVGNKAMIDDSYYGRKHNIYELANLPALIANKVYYPSCYIMFPDPKGILEDKAKAYREETYLATERAKREGLTNGDRPNDYVTRAENWVTIYRLAHK